ncbi:MAG: electron transport complex subunit RsxE [Pseudomonadales bacterium]
MSQDSALATLTRGLHRGNPAWAQLLGLCPLLAVSNSVANALGLALASAFVLIGATVCVSILRKGIPAHARLPVFMLLIATFTTCAVLLLEAFAFDLYQRIALFVQIIVTNCMILGRVETFASKRPPWRSLLDAVGTSLGFAIALLALGATREIVATGTVGAGLGALTGIADAPGWQLWPADYGLPLARLAPGAFLTAALLMALGQGLGQSRRSRKERRNIIQTDTK